ncbi:MAG: hypothetical protein J7L34_07340 [Thermotogaceae bacterium]|nr:hypothetical protein [Thermotogaceae bacterium]
MKIRVVTEKGKTFEWEVNAWNKTVNMGIGIVPLRELPAWLRTFNIKAKEITIIQDGVEKVLLGRGI